MLKQIYCRLQINPNNDKIINDNETSEILTTFNEFVRRAGSDFQRNSTDRVVKFNYSTDDVAVQVCLFLCQNHHFLACQNKKSVYFTVASD